MFNLQPFLGKTIRSIQKRQGGEQVLIYFEDDSFLIITADSHSNHNGYSRIVNELTFAGRAMVDSK